MGDNKTAINTNICLLCLWKGQVALGGEWLHLHDAEQQNNQSLLQKPPKNQISKWCLTVGKNVSGMSTDHMCTLDHRRRRLTGSHPGNSHPSNETVRKETITLSGNNDLDCNETGSDCISEEFHVLLAIKAACKVALKVN